MGKSKAEKLNNGEKVIIDLDAGKTGQCIVSLKDGIYIGSANIGYVLTEKAATEMYTVLGLFLKKHKKSPNPREFWAPS